jgi:hypothetical protein
MTSQELKTLYNENFWQDGQPQEVVCTITIRVGEQEVGIAGIALQPAHTVDSIFKTMHTYLLENESAPPLAEPLVHVPAHIPSLPGIVDIDSVEYREKTYLVERIDQDTFVVKNDKGETINAKSPTARSVIKAYKENL